MILDFLYALFYLLLVLVLIVLVLVLAIPLGILGGIGYGTYRLIRR